MNESVVCESRATTSKLLAMIINGNTTHIEGVKVDKDTAEKLLKIYDLMDVSGQMTFDKTKIMDILVAYKNK